MRRAILVLVALAVIGLGWLAVRMFLGGRDGAGKEEDAGKAVGQEASQYYDLLKSRHYVRMYRYEEIARTGMVEPEKYVDSMRRMYCVNEITAVDVGKPVMSASGRQANVRVYLKFEGPFAKDMKASFISSWVRRDDRWYKLPSKSQCKAFGVPEPELLDPDSD